jgi:hypothetical protein
MREIIHQDEVVRPGAEARDLLRLVRSGTETVESVRRMIGASPDRRAVLLAFDVACMRLSRNRRRICQRIKPQNVSRLVRNRVALLMEAGWSKKKIRASLPVSWPLLQEIADEVQPSLYKRSCGRRLSAQTKEQLQAAIAEGKSPLEIRWQFGVSYPLIMRYRRAMGLHEDCRFRKKLSPAQIKEAEAMLRSGEKWITVANKFGVYESTLLQRISYRKGGRWPAALASPSNQ